MSKLSFCFLLVFLLFSSVASGQVFDFEDESFTAGMEIFDQYSGIPCGVKFYIGPVSDNVHPIIATVGEDDGNGNGTAFNGINRSEPNCGINTSITANMPADGEDVGCKFLTDPDGTANNAAANLNIVYDNVTYKASGYLLDIDGNEEWTITAHTDINNDSPIGTPIVLSGNGNMDNDGKATYWEFNFEIEGTPFKRIEIEHTGSSSSVGLAFDNFSACSVIEDDCCCEEILKELELLKIELSEIKELLKKNKKDK